MKKIVLFLITVIISFGSVNGAKMCLPPAPELFDKRELLYIFSDNISVNYELNSVLKNKLNKILLKFNVSQKRVLFKKLDKKLKSILTNYRNTLNKKYNNKYVKSYTADETKRIKLLFWLYNYFSNEFWKIDIRFDNQQEYRLIHTLDSGESLELKSNYYPHNASANCTNVKIGNHSIFENSDIRKNMKYKIIEKEKKIFLISYYSFGVNKIKVEIYKIWKWVSSFKQPSYYATWTEDNLEEIINIWMKLNISNSSVSSRKNNFQISQERGQVLNYKELPDTNYLYLIENQKKYMVEHSDWDIKNIIVVNNMLILYDAKYPLKKWKSIYSIQNKTLIWYMKKESKEISLHCVHGSNLNGEYFFKFDMKTWKRNIFDTYKECDK